MIVDSTTKGLITKATKLTGADQVRALRKAYQRIMPREQAKHAARRLIEARA